MLYSIGYALSFSVSAVLQYYIRFFRCFL